MARLPLTLVGLLVCVLPGAARGWGFDGHRALAARLHEPLPQGSCLRGWLEAHQGPSFQSKSVDPDVWRGSDADEWPRHYLSIDYANPVSSYPRAYEAAVEQFGSFNANRNGRVPWRVEEYYARLVDELHSSRFDAALTTIAHLSHYVTDAFSLLHATRNFDPDGLHKRWETDMLDVPGHLNELATLMKRYYGTIGRASPRRDTFGAILVGNSLVPKLIAADAASAGNVTDLFARTKDLTARRFGDAVTLTAALVASAWVDAGSPRLPSAPSGCASEVFTGALTLAGHALPERPPEDGIDGAPERGPYAEDEQGGCRGCSGNSPATVGFGVLGLLAAFGQGRAPRRRRRTP